MPPPLLIRDSFMMLVRTVNDNWNYSVWNIGHPSESQGGHIKTAIKAGKQIWPSTLVDELSIWDALSKLFNSLSQCGEKLKTRWRDPRSVKRRLKSIVELTDILQRSGSMGHCRPLGSRTVGHRAGWPGEATQLGITLYKKEPGSVFPLRTTHRASVCLRQK